MAKLYLKRYGHKVLNNGYEVVPIKPGTKHPTFDYSHAKLPKITHKLIDRWQSNGHAKDGIGIRTRYTPMFDIDSTWEPMVEACIKDAEDVIGYAPARVGNAPKVGLVYRSIETFKKVQSKAFTDPNGNKAAVEFLGDGQQFVALAIHPDIKRPYRWTDKGMNPVRMHHDDLVTVTQEQALEVVQRFEQRCIEWGWSRWKTKDKKSTALTTIPARDPDDITGTTPLGLSVDEVRTWVERLENDDTVEYEDNYDLNPEKPNYRNVLFAIWHETDGSEEGRDIAWDWSIRSPKHEEEEGRFDKLWNSADHKDRDDAITFRYIIKCVLVAEEQQKRELLEGYLDSLVNVDDHYDLKALCEKISKTRFEEFDLERLAHAVKSAYARVNRVTLPIDRARKMLYHRPTTDELPGWVKPWNYIRHTGRFYNRETQEEIDHKSFESAFSRYLNGASAIDFALNKAQIKTYYIQMYKPDDDEEFWFQGHDCINTFSERLMPSMPGRYSKADLDAIEIVKAHLKNVIPNKRERAIFLSFLSYVVKTRKRPNWAVVFQGVDGDGKTFFGELMGAILGSNNVRMLDAQQLEDKYTAWAVGQLFCFIEELRLQGHSRYDILNKVKPYITNNAVNVHPKNVNPYTALNTTAYMATTNFKDALPLNDNDRRYFVLMSKWQTGEQLRTFLDKNPGYFDRLFKTLERGGALRQWLMEYEAHEEFNPKGRAPLTRARSEMVELSKSAVQLALEEIIKEDTHPQISNFLIVASALTEYLLDEADEIVNTRSLSSLLSSNGYIKLSFRHRLSGGSDRKESIWVRNRKQFAQTESSQQRTAVMRFLAGRQRKLNHENDPI